MIDTIFEGQVAPEIAFQEHELQKFLSNIAHKSEGDITFQVLRRSIDARSKQVKVNLKARIIDSSIVQPKLINYNQNDLPFVNNQKNVLIIGAGPAGLFAALQLIAEGIKPIILERGQDVRARRRDLAAINKSQIVNPESNYCFGEGGAGTYSDGKLYTRSNKRGDIQKVLEILVAHGASTDILADAHPHIGTNKLPALIQQIRETIISHGGEVHFNTCVTDFKLVNNQIKGITTFSGNTFEADAVLLATGHSARDIFELLHHKSILIEAKDFAIGVRLEHPQELIDKIQYHCDNRLAKYLPPASYSLVEQVNHNGKDAGVFSFCMCPGGFIVPSATAQNEIVVNGMSPSRRDGKYANSGMVVTVGADEWKPFEKSGALAALRLQQDLESKMWNAGGQSQTAAAQRMTDFIDKKSSSTLNHTSYQPGLVSANFDNILPSYLTERLRTAFKRFGQKMKGYNTNEAQIIGIESRTSSPVRIPRDKDTCMHPQISGLFPCGEGAGYAGGIMSAAMDGQRCASQIVQFYSTLPQKS